MKGRRKAHHYSQLIHAYFESPEYAELSPRAVKLLVDLLCQFRGSNNGDLCATYRVLRPRGWRSNDQLVKAIRELLERGWITITRMGGRNVARLYALTMFPIDQCGGKLDVAATTMPSHAWKRPDTNTPAISLHRRTVQLAPQGGSRIVA